MQSTLQSLQDAQTMAQAIVNTIHEPFLVLDAEFRVLAASRSFYAIFKVDPAHTIGCMLYDLGDRQWDIPALRTLLETILPERAEMDGFEVDHDFPGVGRRVMLLNARKVVYETSPVMTILLAFTDVTERRALEQDKAELLLKSQALVQEKQMLLQEMEHRVANSLQIIASILLLKARAVTSEETRLHLRDAHQRVMSVASVQAHLHATAGIDRIDVGAYLAKLCASLAASMVGEDQPVALTVEADEGQIGSSQAVSLGLVVTELVMNALKHAFPGGQAGAAVRVSYTSQGAGWKLVVSDNGAADPAPGPAGLGALLVKALAKQLGAQLEVRSHPAGRTTTLTCARVAARVPTAA